MVPASLPPPSLMDSLHVRWRCRTPQFSITHRISYLVTSPATVCSPCVPLSSRSRCAPASSGLSRSPIRSVSVIDAWLSLFASCARFSPPSLVASQQCWNDWGLTTSHLFNKSSSNLDIWRSEGRKLCLMSS
ncbi:hypothetical protein PIB30_033757 [Stylosanthes scabra]|uniref:Uncharacterized protein n=1 Tax=Stylosanthes scabra TaxID=79078 RepID=A0ABU6SDQ4_9FABA|nr:hypothetical protein [Stylosanthes scabra]